MCERESESMSGTVLCGVVLSVIDAAALDLPEELDGAVPDRAERPNNCSVDGVSFTRIAQQCLEVLDPAPVIKATCGEKISRA